MICSKLKPIGKNLVSTVGKSPTTPKPGWLKRPCRSELMTSGDDALAHGALHKIEIKVAAGMADVEDHAALFGLAHQRQKFSLVVDDRWLLRRVAVRDDIAGAQRIGDLIHADGRVADVHHDRRARRLAGLDRQAQRFSAVFADGFLVQAHFDTDADVAVIADGLGSAVGIREIRG